MLMATILALLLADASPAPSATPNIPCEGKCLAGFAIGDDANRALAKFGRRQLPASDTRVLGDFEGFPGFMIGLYYYEGRIVAVSLNSLSGGPTPTVRDPYGVALKDSEQRLTALRGKADATSANILRYGSVDTVHWEYTIEDGVVSGIMVCGLPDVQGSCG
jgi:hypothetical protein